MTKIVGSGKTQGNSQKLLVIAITYLFTFHQHSKKLAFDLFRNFRSKLATQIVRECRRILSGFLDDKPSGGSKFFRICNIEEYRNRELRIKCF